MPWEMNDDDDDNNNNNNGINPQLWMPSVGSPTTNNDNTTSQILFPTAQPQMFAFQQQFTQQPQQSSDPVSISAVSAAAALAVPTTAAPGVVSTTFSQQIIDPHTATVTTTTTSVHHPPQQQAQSVPALTTTTIGDQRQWQSPPGLLFPFGAHNDCSDVSGVHLSPFNTSSTTGNDSTPPNNNIHQDCERARLEMEEAIRNMPLEQKKDYLEAREHSPEVPADEMDILMFVRRCDFNIWAAAKRMCLYWKERKRLFGSRAFLPMTITSDGALTREDVLSLRAGYPAVLPDTTSGRKVLFIDRRQYVPFSTHENRLRCLFYMFHYMARDDERSQTEGVLCFVIAVLPRLHELDYDYIKKALWLASTVAPIKVQLHLLNSSPAGRKLYPVQDLIVFIVTSMLEAGFSSDMIHVHFEREGCETLLDIMENKGLKREGIPNFLGGSWTWMQSAEWCRQQAAKEREQHKWTLLVARRRQNSQEETDAAAGAGTPPAAKKDQRVKKRERNLIYSRRKRDRRRLEQQNLQDEHDELIQENAQLRQEQRWLEGLLDDAQRFVASLKGC